MLNVLKQLQNSMTSKDDQVRAQATHQFRIQLETMEITQNEAEFLFDFFVHKLNDSQSILDSTWILLNLSKHINQLNTQLLSLINKKTLSVPQLQREARINIYEILLIYPMSHELASAIILSITGEKDPRNILVAFKLCKTILDKKEIAKQYKKDLFEYLDCYYPIEFDDKADKRFSIKASEIEILLNECLFSETLLNDSILLLQDKIVSAYDKAQGAALKSVNWILNNQKALTNNQVDEIYDSIQKLTDSIIMDDEVILQIPFTLREILNQERFQKIGNKILKVALKTIEEIPATQQGYIYFNFIKLLIQNKQMLVFQNIVQIFIKKFDTYNVNVAQKRLETIITTLTEYKKNKLPFIQELSDTEKEKLITILYESLKHNLMNIFVLSLKSLIEIIDFFKEKYQQVENLLFDQLPDRNLIEQQCILDYFCKHRIINVEKYKSLIEFWEQNNQPLFDYSIQCSFKNLQDYFSQFILQNALSQTPKLNQQHINLIKSYLDDEQIEQQQVQSQVQIIINGIFQENVEIYVKSKEIKQILKTIFKQFNLSNDFIDSLNFQKILNLKENQLYYLILILNKEKSQNIVPNIIQQIYENKFQIKEPSQLQIRNQIYKFIFQCLLFFNLDLNLDFPSISQIKFTYNEADLNQLQLYIIILRHQLLIGNQKTFQKIVEIAKEEPELIKQIIKEKYYKNHPQQLQLIQELINSTTNKSLLNYLFNLLDDEQILNFSNQQVLEVIIEQFNDNKIDQLKSISQIVSICQKLKLPAIQYLVQIETTNIQALYTLINVIMHNYEEAKYNLDLYQKGLMFMKKYLNYHKRIVRQAAQEAINEWCIVFSKGL